MRGLSTSIGIEVAKSGVIGGFIIGKNSLNTLGRVDLAAMSSDNAKRRRKQSNRRLCA
jgi:hypothetical protein